MGADWHVLPTPRAMGATALTDGFYYARLKMGGVDT
jgi:hypothetical protein